MMYSGSSTRWAGSPEARGGVGGCVGATGSSGGEPRLARPVLVALLLVVLLLGHGRHGLGYGPRLRRVRFLGLPGRRLDGHGQLQLLAGLGHGLILVVVLLVVVLGLAKGEPPATRGARGVEFELDELLHQCFSVETHDKMFHHYNFTVKMKEAGSDKWSSSTLYFAQVKEMYGRKFYFCYPLDPNEDGICYACKNQGMNALQHPAVPIGYETGQPDAGCPFVDDDSDDDCVADNDAFVRAFEQVFCNGRRV
ncbi:hypothetical protein D1007_59114 [Hordeum vulgare]|nr:hypothetical protein D1007_59114 [Hordeum vulgare]